MSLFSLLLLLGVALFLLALEIFLIPGVTVFGVAGIICLVVVNILAFTNFGASVGFMFLMGTAALGIFMFYGGYKLFNQSGVALNKTLAGNKVPDIEEQARSFNTSVNVGDFGIAFGDIKPQGKAIINAIVYEVRSTGNYISDNTTVVVVKIENTKIWVKAVE